MQKISALKFTLYSSNPFLTQDLLNFLKLKRELKGVGKCISPKQSHGTDLEAFMSCFDNPSTELLCVPKYFPDSGPSSIQKQNLGT